MKSFTRLTLSCALLLASGLIVAEPETTARTTQPHAPRVQLADGHWLSVGGDVASTHPSNQAKLDDQTIGPMLHARQGHSATLMSDGRVLIWGGIGNNGRIVSTGEWFDPRTKKFSPTGPIDLIPRTGHRAVLQVDGRVLMIGGRADGIAELTRIEAWDAKHNRSTLLDADAAVYGVRQLAAAVVRDTTSISTENSGSKLPHSTSFVDAGPDPHALDLGLDLESTPTLQNPITLTTTHPTHKSNAIPLDTFIGLQFSAPVPANFWKQNPISLIGPRGQETFDLVPAEHGTLLFITPKQELLPASRYTVVIAGARLAPTTLEFETESVVPARADPRVSVHTGNQRDLAELVANDTQSNPTANTAPPNMQLVGEGAQALRTRRIAAQFHFNEAKSTDPDFWVPSADNLDGQWRTGRPITSEARTQWALGMSVNQREKAWRSKLLKSSGTALTGRIYSIGDRPLAGVSVAIGKRSTTTDAEGRYQFTGVPAGHQQLVVDGRTVATTAGDSFGQFVIGVDLVKGKETPVNPIYLPKIRAQDWIDIESPLRTAITVRTPLMPGFSVYLPEGTVLRDREGKVVRRVAIIPMPLDRVAINYPVNTPLHMTFQPAGLQVEGLTPGVTPGIRFVYPNYSGAEPGRVAEFLNYDPIEKGWYAYGSGRVSEDGLHVVPDAGTEIYKATGFGVALDTPAPPVTPQHEGVCGGDPVDLRTGLFMHHASGASLSDRLPVQVNTTYRPGDSVSRDFGKGVFHAYSHYLYNPSNNSTNWDLIWLVLPDCSKIPFRRTSPTGSGHTAAYVAKNFEVPGAWYGAALTFTNAAIGESETVVFAIQRRDGLRLVFQSHGGQLQYLSDRHNNKIELTRIGGALTRITGPSGRYLDLTATLSNPRVSQVTDMGGRNWQYSYDANQRLTRITYPDASFERYVYDTNGRMSEVWDQRGNRMVLNQYDTAGRVIHQTLSDGGTYQLSYTEQAGQITETRVTDPTGSTERVRFHASGYPSETTEALGTALERTTYQVRNAIGLIQAIIDPLNRRTEFGYDSEQRLTSTTVLAGTAQALTSTLAYNANHDPISSTDPEGRTSTFVWDNRRRLTQIIDDRNRAISYAYDSQDHVVSVTDPENRTTSFAYQLHDLLRITAPQGKVIQRYVDALGRTLSITDEQGRTARLEYDTLDRVIKQIAPDGSITVVTYDPMGNLKSLTDAKLSVTQWDYDTRQRPILHRDALNQIETWSYEDAGRRYMHTDRLGRTSMHWFDELGRTYEIELNDAHIQMWYDTADRLLSIADGSGTISYQYDVLDNMLQESTPAGSIDYTYDAIGRLTKSTVSTDTIDPFAHPITHYAYDTHGRLINIQNQWASVAFGYDAQDRRISITLPNGTEQLNTFDINDRLSRIEYRRGGAQIGDLNYAFDASGQLIERSGSLADDLLPDASSGTFNANHQIAQADAHSYTFDAEGNLIVDATPTDTRNYSYDARNRLIEINSSSNGRIATFDYDVHGRRTRVDISGVGRTQYRYDGNNVVEKSTGVITALLNGPGLDERYSRTIGIENQTSTGTYLTDILGSTIGLQSANGNWQARYRYSPYGETQAQAFDSYGTALPPGPDADAALAAIGNTFQYTGRENDGNGLYYYRARYYQPKQGRFTQEDPLGFVDGPNPYAYVGGNPMQFRDPLGLWAWGDELPQWLVDGGAGLGDALLLGTGGTLRRWVGVDGGIDVCSASYKYGGWASFAFGGARLGYAALAKGGSILASSGAAASAFREQLKVVFRLGLGRNWRRPALGKYATDAEFRYAAGRTNSYLNAYGGGVAAAGVAGAAGTNCDCQK